jgi:uncharacterized protein
VPRLGPKTFEQCAGFLRIRDGDDPLDASAVHPEAYPVVQRILAATGRSVAELIGNERHPACLRPERFTDERFGLPTVATSSPSWRSPAATRARLSRPPKFRTASRPSKDLKPGMRWRVVTNVTNFGAFVDIGVHQDGLVHISALSDRFVKDPHEVVKAGDIVKVKVMEDKPRKRIALTMRLGDEPGARTASQEMRGGSDARSKPGASPRAEARPIGPRPIVSQAPSLRLARQPPPGGLWRVPSPRPGMA